MHTPASRAQNAKHRGALGRSMGLVGSTQSPAGPARHRTTRIQECDVSVPSRLPCQSADCPSCEAGVGQCLTQITAHPRPLVIEEQRKTTVDAPTTKMNMNMNWPGVKFQKAW